MVSTSSGPLGSYLTADSGRSVYLWEADSAGTSTCTGACASVWPPVTTTGTPQASGGATASDLGTITRSDGSHQVTYAGHPLYYFAKDSAPGQTTGEGSNGFGAKWWLVSPTGSPITSGASVSSSPTASSGGGY